jgi:uncharacterized delta-60 repeat protein
MSHHKGVQLLLAALAMTAILDTDRLLAQDLAGGFATRFTSSGSLDATFGPYGGATLFGSHSAIAAAVDEQNRIIVAGTKDGQFVVTRLSASGSLDPTFGTNGVAKRAFAGAAEARAVAVDSWGRIMVAGTSSNKFALACFSDSGGGCWFDSDAKITTAFPYPAGASAIAVGTDGRIVVGGSVSSWNNATSAKNEMFAVVRYTSIGTLDSTFGSGGKVVFDAGSGVWNEQNRESISGLALDGNGRIVAAGTFAAKSVRPRFAVIRFLQNGQLDTTFGPQSTGLVTAFGGCSWTAGCFEEASASSLALQSDGKIVVAGSVRPLNSGSLAYDVALVRLLSNGSRDVSGFGVDGYVQTDAGNFDEAFALKVAGASLYVAGHSGGQSLVARYSISDGALDTAFGGDVIVQNYPCVTLSPAYAVVVQVVYRGGGFTPLRKPVIVGTCFS